MSDNLHTPLAALAASGRVRLLGRHRRFRQRINLSSPKYNRKPQNHRLFHWLGVLSSQGPRAIHSTSCTVRVGPGPACKGGLSVPCLGLALSDMPWLPNGNPQHKRTAMVLLAAVLFSMTEVRIPNRQFFNRSSTLAYPRTPGSTSRRNSRGVPWGHARGRWARPHLLQIWLPNRSW